MPEQTLFETEQSQSRSEIAAYLRSVADSLDAGGPLTLAAGDQSVELDPANPSTFEVKAEREGPTDALGELSVEFEIEWDESDDGDGSDGELRIE